MAAAILGAVPCSWKPLKKLEETAENTPVLFLLQEVLLLLLGIIDVMCIVNSTYSPFLYFQY